MIVPPVPTPATRTSIAPSVSSQISGPVVSSWIAGLAGFLNCCGMKKLPGSLRGDLFGFRDGALHALRAGVRIISAPSAASTLRRSMLMVSGMVRVSL